MPKRDREAVSQGMADIFAGASGDLLGNVISRDRERAGRPPPPVTPDPPAATPPDPKPPHSDTMTSQPVIGEYDKQTDIQATGQADTQAGTTASHAAVGQPDTPPETPAPETSARRDPRKRGAKQEAPDILATRLAEATRMAESPTTTVTLRVPQELNGWLDEYVHRAWPERVRKQELVTEALRMLFARRGRPGEPIVTTELLIEPKKD